MDTESRFGQTEQDTRAFGFTTKPKGEESSGMLMVILMKVIG